MIRPWNAIAELSRLERNINSLFSELWRDLSPKTLIEEELGGFPVDVIDQGDSLTVRAELPGVDKENIELNCTEDTVSIAVEKKSDIVVKDQYWLRRESSFGKAVRVIRLDSPVDPTRAEASLKNGVLTVRLPKTQPSKRGHRIQID
ncbi:MAG: Hsp20/alpha crystallin family protein [Candidatus Fermentithermobacillus carboniphilus]|uniref:Hsp20/alpha crystallin family protein n=1 Tax=Candidatus Fermentithermobacillus carboniphilus TaxID=3085328 RepID=A0AAT9LC69_9FIRM|nr:MAG: Hsp20/alpha crystallin family protein [Candidatus Fermentithermobacillus carboniphilus]